MVINIFIFHSFNDLANLIAQVYKVHVCEAQGGGIGVQAQFEEIIQGFAKLSFNFKYILVESWDSHFQHPPTTTRQTEKVVNHATSSILLHLRPSLTPASTEKSLSLD